jgi:CDP-diacylglycerol--serine O-phosphatidyltransferase
MAKKDSANESFPIAKLIPNVATIIGLCFGLFALKFAVAEEPRWELAVGLIVIATFIDGIDGRLARMLNASSDFGAQLDSLSDFFNFGVAPALVLYLWMGHEIKGLGWAVALFFIITQALRLARFNTSLNDEEHNDNYFYGIPAPCGAGLSLLPMIITFFFNEHLGGESLFEITPIMVIIYMAVIAILMVSSVPTISVKKLVIQRKYAKIFLALAGLFVVALITEPWVTLPLMGIFYLATIPFSVFCYYRK